MRKMAAWSRRRPDDQVIAGGAAEGGDKGDTVDRETDDPKRGLGLDGDDEKRDQRDQAGADADNMDAAVGDALALRVFRKQHTTHPNHPFSLT